MNSCRIHRALSWVFQWVAAAILLQTLFFKFTGAEESKYIFTALGIEPWGRIATGLVELVAVGLLLWNRTAVFGAMLSLGLMTGAIAGHLTKLGLVVKNDSGLLFALAVTVFGASLIMVWLRRNEVPRLGRWLSPFTGPGRTPTKSGDVTCN